MRLTLACFILCTASLGASFAAAADDLTPLLSKLPSDTNTLSIIRLKAMLTSPRGVRENWAQKYEAGYLEGALTIPPVVDTLAIGAEVGAGDNGDVPRVAVFTLATQVKFDPATVARRQNGRTEYVGGQMVVFSPHYGYLAQLPSGMVGLFPPGDRQQLSKWLRGSKENRPVGFAEYLQDAVKKAGDAHILLAIDAAEMGDSAVAKKWAAESTVLEGKPQAAAVSDIVGTLIGVRFAATVGDDLLAKITIDFGAPVGEHAGMLHALFLAWLAETGASLDELRTAKASADGNSLVLETPLSNRSLRRVMTLLQVPTLAAADHPAGQSVLPEADVTASRRYFNAIDQILSDLNSQGRSKESYEQSSLWHDNYADKIDLFPTVNVAPELIQFGAAVSASLRAMSRSLEGEPHALDVLEMEKYSRGLYQPRYSVQMGAYGPVPGMTWHVANFSDIRRNQNTAVRDGANQRDALWGQIRAAREKVLGQMKLKFKVDLTAPSTGN